MVAQILAFAAGAVLLAGLLVFSLLIFAVVVSVALVVSGYLWWSTRALRKRVREQLRTADARRRPRDSGSVIEGDFVRDPESDHR